MKQRGRPSSASLMLATQRLDTMERLKPPHGLGHEQLEVWWLIVSGHPADWFDVGSVALLTQLCRHVVMSNRVAGLLDEAEDTAQLMELLKEQRAESDAIRKLSSSLRITPQSLINQRGNKKPLSAIISSPHSRIANAG
jgi:hypothetical protein